MFFFRLGDKSNYRWAVNSYLLLINFVCVNFVIIQLLLIKTLHINVLCRKMLHIDFTSYKKRNVLYTFCYIYIHLSTNKFVIINFVVLPHTVRCTYMYICLCTNLQKCTTPRRESDVWKTNKQVDSFQSVYILYAFGWFL
jgi:hypothetical protein